MTPSLEELIARLNKGEEDPSQPSGFGTPFKGYRQEEQEDEEDLGGALGDDPPGSPILTR